MTRGNGVRPGGATTFGVPTTRADTLADRAEFLTSGLRPLACRRCGTEVLVKKNSVKHTSIQWTSDPASACPRYAEQVTTGARTALLDTCPDLADSIDRAVVAGEIEVGA